MTPFLGRPVCCNRTVNNQSIVSINPKKKSELDPEFLYYVLKGLYKQIRNLTGDNERSGLNMPIIRNIRIPKPSIDIQSKLVLQIKEEQKCTLAAKEMIKLFEQKIKDKISEVWGE